MLVVFSGEGPGDIGGSSNSTCLCGTSDFKPGPLAVMALQRIEECVGYSPVDYDLVFWVSRGELSRLSRELPRVPKFATPGAKSPREILAFSRSAQAMGEYTKRLEADHSVLGMAVLFHDCDGTRADSANRWGHIRDAMMRGFDAASFTRGVPMIPRPKQEAWFLCALKNDPYVGCEALEESSGNDSSPFSLKSMLEAAVGRNLSSDELVDIVQNGLIEWNRIEMPSLRAFFDRMEDVLSSLSRGSGEFSA